MRVGIFDHMDCAHSVKALDGCDVTHGHTYKVKVRALKVGSIGASSYDESGDVFRRA